MSTSCIIALPGEEVRIDEAFLVGPSHAEMIRRQLTETFGLVDPDVCFVGTYAETRAPSALGSLLERALDIVIE